MAEQTDAFRRRAFRAAGPVFLVAVGIVLLAVLLVTTLVAPLPGNVAWTFALVGLAALLGGFAWGALSGGRDAAARGGRSL